MKNKRMTLAVDTSISQGSFSLWNDGVEIYSLIGNKSTARSEDILVLVKQLLDKTDSLKNEITKVLFTSGPGSYTGLRVGVASMLGFCHALGVPFETYSVLEVFAIESVIGERSITFLETGRREVVYQEFSRNSDNLERTTTPKNLKLDAFVEMLKNKEFDSLIGQAQSLGKITDENMFRINPVSDNVAKLIYRFSTKYGDDKKENRLSITYGADF